MADSALRNAPPAGSADTAPLAIEVSNLRVSYGSVRALFGVSFQLKAGNVLAVLGPNGAAKSTLARALCGLLPAESGQISFGGTDITGWRPDKIFRSGLVYVPEGRGIFRSLSVIENLKIATRTLKPRVERQSAIDSAIELFPVLGKRTQQRAGTLSGGEQQMLALARAFSVGAKLIIADEISLGLAPLIVEQCFESLRLAAEQGTTMIIVEQFVERALDLADDCLILNRGRVGWTGPAAAASDEVRTRYLG